MSTDGTPQPAPEAGTKPAAPAPKKQFINAIIDKSTSAKKVLPKVVRRRPGAAAAAKPAAKPVPAEKPAERPVERPADEAQPAGQAAQAAQAAPQPTTEQAPLPTPAATQEPAQGGAVQTAPAAPPPHEPTASTPQPIGHTSPRHALEDPAPSSSPKRARIEAEAIASTVPHMEAQSTPALTQTAAREPVDSQPTTEAQPAARLGLIEDPAHEETSTSTPAPAVEAPPAPSFQTTTPTRATTQEAASADELEPSAERPTEDESRPTQEPQAPLWATVNRPRRGRGAQPVEQPAEGNDEDEDGDLDVVTGTTTNSRARRKAPASKKADQKTKAPARAKRQATGATRKRNVTAVEADEVAAIGDDEEEAAEEDGAEEPPAKKQRKTRKANGTPKSKSTMHERQARDDGEHGADNGEEDTTARPRTKKKKAPRKKKATDGTTENGEAPEDVPQRKKRGHARSPTPEQTQPMDPTKVYMDELTTDIKKYGKLSRRELKMREINWAEVREKRRRQEAESRNLTWQTQAERRIDEEAEQAENERVARERGPQYEMVDGQIVMKEVIIDEGAQANQAIQVMEITEEDDLTQRITSRSFLQNNKRFPNEFMLPGQGKRWTQEGTDFFYDALGMFGTDFMMISTMFPGTTRKSIKTKFTREERENPERIKAALAAPRNTEWTEYLNACGKDDSAFVNPDAIKRELEEERKKFEVQIEDARKIREEEKRQMRLAGVEDSGEEEAYRKAEKEKEKKGKKKERKAREKAVTFQDDENVEILGVIEDE
ncbi:hypothetical protein P154DRAFT_617073 [Amniculicola lignicola CBS 123094]|uniref:Transcription factor TFIIIB component B'' Myb domain-containing protein n=1 Tax=Amniculicola lignicola CBS 123094 TaxID=1392246 RepID=A0A6A5WRQ8_9PLEO|nr:hypothetical protein P154DRAFT_617073 [Amniculicola lignicola CBS 123094]